MAKSPRRRTAQASRPKSKMRIDRDVYVTMPDGTRISCGIWRPDADGLANPVESQATTP